MWEGIAIVAVIILGDIRTVEPVQPIGGSDPEKALIVLCDVGDRIAAEAFFRSQPFNKMRSRLRDKKGGEQLAG